MKDEYNSQECMVCSAPADGLHYGAISCRSCNAFFRRTVVEKAEYRCKHTNNCIIDPEGRCACRSCRFSKCIEAGMKVSAVQPRRDPTGSQKERRKRTGGVVDMMSVTSSPLEQRSSLSFSSDGPTPSGSFIIDAIKTDYGFTTPRRVSMDYMNSPDRYGKIVKIEMEDEPLPSTSSAPENLSRQCSPADDEQQEFENLVYAYGEHQRMMQLSFSTFEQFLEEKNNGPKLRQMDPTDVSKLSAVELTGLLYWIEKQQPYNTLPLDDKSVLLKRYSVRKLSLDHFYSASKHPEYCERGEFVMNNFTFVPNNRTGFELPDDDDYQIEAKRETFAPTFNRFWRNVIRPFVTMKIIDAEIVFLHIMLLWSVTNNEHVSEETRKIMKTRRDWAMSRLFDYYNDHGTHDPALRLGEMILLLGEIELICDMHCQDFQVAKLFEFCDMSKFWYETLCYAPCNTNVLKFDPNLLENLKRFTAISVMEANGQMGYIKAEIKPEIKSEPSMYGSTPDMDLHQHNMYMTPNTMDFMQKTGQMNANLANIDPGLLVFNAHMLPSVMAPLPDDTDFSNASLFQMPHDQIMLSN